MNNNINTDIQLKILNIFKYVKNICDSNNLKYYAIGGTCIGAVRHKGFIPWDDDLDIAMPFCDYVKMKQLIKNSNVNFSLIDPIDYKSHLFFSKVQDENTTYVEAAEIDNIEQYKGIWVDIMPICGIPKKGFTKKVMLLKLRYYSMMNEKNNFSLNRLERSKIGKIIWLITYPIRKMHKKNYYVIKHEEILSKYPISEKYDVLFPWRIPLRKNSTYNNIFPYEYFKDTVEIPFEDTSISCPIDYDKYLKMDFDDYMKLPPKEKQVTHHDEGGIIDLEKSYKIYQLERKNKI